MYENISVKVERQKTDSIIFHLYLKKVSFRKFFEIKMKY